MFRLAGVKKSVAGMLPPAVARRVQSEEHGFAVVLTLLIIIIMAMLALSLMTVAAFQWQDADRTRPSNRAFDLADAGLSYGRAYIAREGELPYPPDNPPIQMGGAGSTFDLTIEEVEPIGQYRYIVVSTGTYQASERGSARNYTRTLEEVVEFRGASGHFDAFNYCMFSRDGDVTLDTGWMGLNATSFSVDGDIYAGRDVKLTDDKRFLAYGILEVTGSVTAKRNFDITSYTGNGVLALASVSVLGDVTATDVSIKARTLAGAITAATANVNGSINASNNVSIIAETTKDALSLFAGALVNVAQVPYSSVNAKGTVDLSSVVGYVAGAGIYVGIGDVTHSDVNADGNVTMSSTAGAVAVAETKVWGSVNTRAQANLSAYCNAVAVSNTIVNKNVKSNGSSRLSATSPDWLGWALAFPKVDIGGTWQHSAASHIDPIKNWWGVVNVPNHSHTYPDVGNAPVVAVPDVTLPVPDWSWYRTMAVAQGAGHHYVGDKTFDSVTIDGDPSSMWVLYVEGNVTINQLIYNVEKRGVIVSEGDVTIRHDFQILPNSEYQVIARGNVTHESAWTLNWDATDRLFIYTDGSYLPDRVGGSGNVIYDLGWFRDIKGQITARGNISAPTGGFIRLAKITYDAPMVPVEAWPIPFRVISFREL